MGNKKNILQTVFSGFALPAVLMVLSLLFLPSGVFAQGIPAGCTDVDSNGVINEIDCGAPENASCPAAICGGASGINRASAAGINSAIFGSLEKLFGGSADSPAGAKDLGKLIIAVVQILLVVAASVATIFLIVGGYRYVTASGSEEQTEAAKKTMSGAIIGLVVIVLSFAIVRIISAVLLGGAPGTGI